MPTKERWAKMSPEQKAVYTEQHKKWVDKNRDKNKEIVNKSYLKKVGGELSRLSPLVDTEVRIEHRRKRKAKTVLEWQKNNPDKIKQYRLKQKVSGKDAAKAAKRRAAKLKATPAWADLEEIKNVYLEAQYFGMHVDHIIPLQGKNVCGLHVWDNLQLLPAVDNIRKGNRYALYKDC
jgi:5-methylcytosine-specific restriction endonuclease McrA